MEGPDPAEDVLRALAAAANALRLYPPTSDLRDQAVERFVEVAEGAVSGREALRFRVEPGTFLVGERAVAPGSTQIAHLASTLYSHQVGQLLVSPGLRRREADAFLEALATEPDRLKTRGGLRAALNEHEVSHLAVIEVTLRSSADQRLRDKDLTQAPLDEIGPAVVAAAEQWREQAGKGEAVDEVELSVSSLERAAERVASERVVRALMRMDERTRVQVLASARTKDRSGEPMRGMLTVISRMSPSALARLLTLVARMSDEDPLSVLPELDLPEDLMRELTGMLSPSPRPPERRGVPDSTDASAIAEEVGEEDAEEERRRVRDMVAHATPAEATGRALATATTVARMKPNAESVEAMSDALVPALTAGAWREVAGAVELLEELSEMVGLEGAVAAARERLTDQTLLTKACRELDGTEDVDVLATVIDAAGNAGQEVFLRCWTESDEGTRRGLARVIPRIGDRLAGAAGRALRQSDARTAEALVSLIAKLGDQRTTGALVQALRRSEPSVRSAAVRALGAVGGEEAGKALGEALSHADRRTRIEAAKEIGHAKLVSALPALHAALERYHLFERDLEFKSELVRSISAIGSGSSIPVLERASGKGLALGSANRALKRLAAAAARNIREESMSRG